MISFFDKILESSSGNITGRKRLTKAESKKRDEFFNFVITQLNKNKREKTLIEKLKDRLT